jgi:hypothetical protein
MHLVDLISAHIFRDGGSYEAAFTTDDAGVYRVRLERSRMPDHDGLHHGQLLEYRSLEPGAKGAAIARKSAKERELLRQLDELLARDNAATPRTSGAVDPLQRLKELRDYIPRRES